MCSNCVNYFLHIFLFEFNEEAPDYPSDTDKDRLKALIHNDPSQSTHELATMIDCDYSTIVPTTKISSHHLCFFVGLSDCY